MRWPEIRSNYPDQWLVIEAVEAHTDGRHRVLNTLAVCEVCPDGIGALQSCRRLHQQYPRREFYFVHTSRESFEIDEAKWIDIRKARAERVVSLCAERLN